MTTAAEHRGRNEVPAHDSHVYAFWNAPLSLRPDWTRVQIAKMQHELETDTNRSADAYYSLKARIREFSAALVGKTALQHDPAGFWLDNQSN